MNTKRLQCSYASQLVHLSFNFFSCFVQYVHMHLINIRLGFERTQTSWMLTFINDTSVKYTK